MNFSAWWYISVFKKKKKEFKEYNYSYPFHKLFTLVVRPKAEVRFSIMKSQSPTGLPSTAGLPKKEYPLGPETTLFGSSLPS